MSDKSTKKRKRSFSKAWLTDERYKSWIHEISSDSTLYHCIICNKNLSCNSRHVSRHADSSNHRNNIKKNLVLCNNDDSSRKTCQAFQLKWLDIEQYKCWLREVPHDTSLFCCLICDTYLTIGSGLAHIERHAESKKHLDKYENFIETSESNKQSKTLSNKLLMSFEERKKEAEMRYAALIATKNIPFNIAKDILEFFQHLSKDPKVLKSMTMSRTKCKNVITNALYPIERERVVNNVQNTKFSIFIDETSDITNDKWMTFLVRYVDAKTLDIRTQLVKLIDIDAKDSSAEKLFNALKCEMSRLMIPFQNIVALSCDNASVMTGKQKSFKKKLEEVCPNLLTFSCPCHSAALAAHAASKKIPDVCDNFLRKIAKYVNSSPKRSAVFRDFCLSFENRYVKLKKLCETRWLSHYQCVARLLESWDTIELFLTEQVVSEKSKYGEELLFLMRKVDVKAYFLFLKYILNEFNTFNAFFQALETRIHLLQPKSINFLFKICKNFLKDELLKSFYSENTKNIIFSLKENQKLIHEITFGSDCDEYLNELMMLGHEDIVTKVRENCLSFYITAAEEICKRLPVDNTFLSKLNVFQPSISLFNTNRETTFNDVSFVAETIGDFNKDGLKKEWIALPLDFTMEEKQSLSKKTFDEMWKKILKCQDSNNIIKYPNLKSVLNAVQSLPNSNADSERMFSFLSDLKTNKRNKLSSVTVNAICVLKSALKARNETCINMMIEEKHLSYMSPDKLYASTVKKDQSILRLHAMDVNDIAGPSWAN